MCLSQLGVSLGHPNVRMPQDLGQFVQISAMHHEPRGERVPEIMETEVLNTRKRKDGFEAALYSLPFAFRVTTRRLRAT